MQSIPAVRVVDSQRNGSRVPDAARGHPTAPLALEDPALYPLRSRVGSRLELAQTQVAACFPGVDDLYGRLVSQSVIQYIYDARLYVEFCQGDVTTARDPATLRAWRQQMVQTTTLSPRTINRRLAAVKTLVKASARRGVLPSTLATDFSLIEPVSVRALKHRVRHHAALLSPDEARALCRLPNPTSLLGLRDRALLLTLATSGCRISEVVTLRLDQIQRVQGRLVLRIWGKGQDEERLAPLAEEALTWIDRWLRARAQAGVEVPQVFTQFRGSTQVTAEPLTRHGAYIMIRRYGARLGLPHLHPHALRAFVATEVADKFGVRQAQKVLGHRALATTEQHYVKDALQAGITDALF